MALSFLVQRAYSSLLVGLQQRNEISEEKSRALYHEYMEFFHNKKKLFVSGRTNIHEGSAQLNNADFSIKHVCWLNAVTNTLSLAG